MTTATEFLDAFNNSFVNKDSSDIRSFTINSAVLLNGSHTGRTTARRYVDLSGEGIHQSLF